MALFVALIVLIRDHRILQRYAYTLALIGLFLLLLPSVLPARFCEVNGARIWIRVAGFSIQPGEFAKILLTIFGAAYLVAKRDVLVAGRTSRACGIDLPRGRDFGPLLAAWLLCIGVLVRGHDLGTSLMFFGAVRRAALRRHRAGRLGDRRAAAVRRRRLPVLPAVRHGADPRRGLAAPVRAAHEATATSCSSRCSASAPAGVFGTGLGAGHPELVPLPATDFIITSFGEETGLFGLARCWCCTRCSSGAASPPGLACATRSASCWPPGCPSWWRCSCSSSSPASPGCCRRPA